MFRIFIIWLVSMFTFHTFDYYNTVEVGTEAPIKIDFVSVASKSPKRIYRTRDSGKISSTPIQGNIIIYQKGFYGNPVP